MKAIIKTCFGVYTTNGYAHSEIPVAIYPIKAAAESSEESKKLGHYKHISIVKIVQFEDVNYLLDVVVDEESVIGNPKMGTPIVCYHDYQYKNGIDTSKYIIGTENLIEYLNINGRASINKMWIIADSEEYFVLKSDKTLEIKSFLMSREIAIQNALDKLTEEERGLLGL